MNQPEKGQLALVKRIILRRQIVKPFASLKLNVWRIDFCPEDSLPPRAMTHIAVDKTKKSRKSES